MDVTPPSRICPHLMKLDRLASRFTEYKVKGGIKSTVETFQGDVSHIFSEIKYRHSENIAIKRLNLVHHIQTGIWKTGKS